ncbi:hypothetical protein NRA16_17805 [Acinetobacter baumannii]|nr:hypothetical protein [Acinetobacter baumannii]
MIEVLYFLAFAVFALGAGYGFWAFGQWLRRKGHGRKLDRVNQTLTPSQHYRK